MLFSNNSISKTDISTHKHTREFFLLVVLLLIGILSFIYWSSKKEIWFCDEIYTFESAHGMEQTWPAETTGQWMSHAEMEAFFSADSDKLSLKEITYSLYNDHVPLYFWLYRIIAFYGFKGSATIWTGYTLNLSFYLFFLIIGYYFWKHLTKNPLVAAGIMMFSSIINKIMIAQTTTLRMYMMLVWAELILLIFGLRVLQDSRQGKLRWNTYIPLCIFSVIGFLTHYDYWVFYAITAALFCCWLIILAFKKQRSFFWKTTEFKCVIAWGCNFCCSLLLTIFIFPYCRWNLNQGKGKTALHSIFDFSAKKLENIAWGLQRLSASVFGECVSPYVGIVLIFACISGAAIVLFKKKEHKQTTALLLMTLVAIGYQLVICFTMPDVNEERYLWGGFTVIHMCFIWSIYVLIAILITDIKSGKKQIICCVLLNGILSVFLLFAQIRVIDEGNGIPYLFHPDKDVAALEAHNDIPWIVYGPTVGVYSYYDWLIPQEICFLSLDNNLEDTAAVLELQNNKSFLLYTYETYIPQALAFFEEVLDKDLEESLLTTSTNLTVYRIREVN